MTQVKLFFKFAKQYGKTKYMKRLLLNYKSLAVLVLACSILSNEGCQDTREDQDLYGPENEINQSWQDYADDLANRPCKIENTGYDKNSDLYNYAQDHSLWIGKTLYDVSTISTFVGDVYIQEILAVKQGESIQYVYLYENEDFELDENNIYYRVYNCSGEILCESFSKAFIDANPEILFDIDASTCFNSVDELNVLDTYTP